MSKLNDYLDLIDSERRKRPAEAMLADEIRMLRLALEVIADQPAEVGQCEHSAIAEAALRVSYSDDIGTGSSSNSG